MTQPIPADVGTGTPTWPSPTRRPPEPAGPDPPRSGLSSDPSFAGIAVEFRRSQLNFFCDHPADANGCEPRRSPTSFERNLGLVSPPTLPPLRKLDSMDVLRQCFSRNYHEAADHNPERREESRPAAIGPNKVRAGHAPPGEVLEILDASLRYGRRLPQPTASSKVAPPPNMVKTNDAASRPTPADGLT